MKRLGMLRIATAALLGMCVASSAWAQAPDRRATEQRVAAGANQLGITVLGRLLPPDGSRSVVVSPYSLASAMAMLAVGARGETARRLAQGLGVAGLEDEALARAYGDLSASLAAPSDAPDAFTLRVANSLWTAQNLSPLPAYVRSLRASFAAEAAAVDFGAPGTLGRINDWVRSATAEMIPEVVDSLDRDVALLLVNAVYFRSAWAERFDARLTTPQPFRLADGRTRTVPMMSRLAMLSYADRGDTHAIVLPYAGGRVEMIVAAPKDPARTRSFIADGIANRWPVTQPGVTFTTRLVELALPRFRVEAGGDVTAEIRASGLAAAFAPGADLSGIAARMPPATQVMHRVAINVREEGTEAAAATSVIVAIAAQEPSVRFRADLPFLIAIRDRPSGALLFLGLIAEPG